MPVSSAVIALDQFTTFGDLLKYLRRRAGLTQLELSIAVGYSDAQISRLEQNERLPDLATLTARFLPALHAEDQPEVARRLLELAATVRREDAPATGLPPYKGLYYFDESDSELFFGREALTETLMDRLNAGLKADHRFLAIVGASGSGKSSVVRAGLIPALRWRQPSSSWYMYVMTPTSHPLDALAISLQGDVRQGSAKKLADDFARNPQALHSILKPMTETQALFVVDQFEELFTLCRSEAEQTAFVENLLNAALQPRGSAGVIIVLRADFYAHCARFDLLRQALSQHQEYIGPMTVKELRRAIEEPARHGHWEFESGLIEFLLHDVGADVVGHSPEPGALPLLSHALLATWQRRRGRVLTLGGYSASGGVRGAIAETAEAVFHDQLEPEQRTIARQIFMRLTEIGDDATTADTRRRVSFDELVSKPEDNEMVHEVLMRLADARLITTDQNTAEVAHEALIREWPTLRGWLDENRDGLRLHRHLTDAAQEWELLSRDPGILYRGARLAQALGWSHSHADDLNLLERSFLDASQSLAEKETAEREAQRQQQLESARKLFETERARAEEQTKSNRRLRQRAIYLTLASIVAGALALAAIVFGQRSIQAERLATSRELAAAAVNNLSVDPERSVLLALQALDESNTLEARNALHQALPELHILHTISAHRQAANLTYSPDGTRIASMGADGEVKVWDASTYQNLLTLPADPNVLGYTLAYSPDGKLLAAALSTKVVVWDALNGKELFSLDGNVSGAPNNEMVYVTFSPDNKHLAVANMDGTPKVWDVATRAEVFSLVGHKQPCDGIAYSPDGKLLATSDDSGIIKVWDSSTGEELLNLTQSGNVHSVAFSPNGKHLASASEDGTLKLWDSSTGKELLNLRGISGLYDVTFTPDGKRLITAGQDGTARVWDVVSGQQLLTLAGNTSTVTSVSASPDGKRIASSGYDGTLKIWDAAPGRELLTLPAHSDIVWDVAYSSDGKSLATVSADGMAKLWDVATSQVVMEFSPMDGLTSLVFSPDGKYLVTGGASGTLYLWDITTGQSVMKLEGHTYVVYALAISPDGKRLASTSWDGTARLWDLTHGRELLTIPDQWTGVAFSPEGKYIFTSGLDGYVRMWDVSTGQELKKYSDGAQDIYGVTISPDGNLLATGQQDGTITIWDVKSEKKLHTLSGHAGLVARLAFSKDGTRLASASFDRLAKVWDVASGEELFSLYGNTSNVFGISFSPDGQTLATAGGDGTIRVYALQLEDLVALAQSRATRVFTIEECRKFLHMETCP
jgi:WD40 repeat protein/transcriptional regulator with XRE-family HTH domain